VLVNLLANAVDATAQRRSGHRLACPIAVTSVRFGYRTGFQRGSVEPLRARGTPPSPRDGLGSGNLAPLVPRTRMEHRSVTGARGEQSSWGRSRRANRGPKFARPSSCPAGRRERSHEILVVDEQPPRSPGLRQIYWAYATRPRSWRRDRQTTRFCGARCRRPTALVDIRLSAIRGDRGGPRGCENRRASGAQAGGHRGRRPPSSRKFANRDAPRSPGIRAEGELSPRCAADQSRVRERLNLRARERLRSASTSRGTGRVIGSSPGWIVLRRLVVDAWRDANSPVIIRGENAGKRNVAARFTRRAAGATRVQVAVNCSAIQGALISHLISDTKRGRLHRDDTACVESSSSPEAAPSCSMKIREMPDELQRKSFARVEIAAFER